jgi:hypothetical protein
VSAFCKWYPNVTSLIIAGIVSLLLLTIVYMLLEYMQVLPFKYEADLTVGGCVNYIFLSLFEKFL